MIVTIERGDFWEFQARTSALDLEAVRLRSALAEVKRQHDGIVDAFAERYGLDPGKTMTFEDSDLSVRQV